MGKYINWRWLYPLGGAVASITMAGLTSGSVWLPFVFIGLSVIFGILVGHGMVRTYYDVERKEQAHMNALAILGVQPSTKPKRIQNFCEDCGTQFTSERSIEKYSSGTGDPIYKYRRGCPNYPVMRAKLAGSHASLFSYSSWPNCGDISKRGLVSAHNHPDSGVHTDCPPCIDGMLTDKIITDEQASFLLSKVKGL